MILASALIEKFKYALSNNWGYIWGQSGDVWTQAKQDNATREQTVKYGQKWVGHRVADCSGLFYWAFKQLGGYMYHGSDTMFRKYCTANGTMSNGKRTDGMPLLPGTAVFTWKPADGKYGHVGLFIGNGKVIEAKGTQSGVVESKVTDKRWTHWGELKGIDYSASEADVPPSPTPSDKQPTETLPTLRKGMKGEYVSLLQTKLVNKGYSVGSYGIDGDFGSATLKAVKEFQKDHGLEVDGVVGKKTWAALNEQGSNLYTVTIPNLPKYKAEALIKDYPGSSMREEGV